MNVMRFAMTMKIVADFSSITRKSFVFFTRRDVQRQQVISSHIIQWRTVKVSIIINGYRYIHSISKILDLKILLNLYIFHLESNKKVGWRIVGLKRECAGKSKSLGMIATIGECARECKKEASMFAYGTNDFGTDRCYDQKCKCM